MTVNDERRILDNTVDVATYLLNRDIYQASDVERLLIYEHSHKHRRTMERALIKRMKAVVHIQCKVPTVSDFLKRQW